MKLLTEVIPTALKEIVCLKEHLKTVFLFWVADMDFPCADPVIEALHQRIDRKIYGYTAYDNQDVYEAVSGWFMRQYGGKIEREELSFSPGVVPALAFLIRALTWSREMESSFSGQYTTHLQLKLKMQEEGL